MRKDEADDFVSRICYGEELVFVYKGLKYLLQGTYEDPYHLLYIFSLNSDEGIDWKVYTLTEYFDTDSFLKARIFDGRTFWEAVDEIEWSDFD